MKFEWQECDIYTGRRVIAYNLTEEYIIGYDPRFYSRDNRRFTLTSLIDGMLVVANHSTQALVEHLNVSQMRPLTIDEP